MTSVIKNVGPKLIPFFKAIAVYFVVFIPHTKPGFLAAFLKCMPIISLMIFVVWYQKHIDKELQWYPRRILFGLFFSCIGDFCLIWPELFTLGMVSFAIGHINYITAFGFKPLKLPIAVFVYLITLLGCLYLMPGLEGVLIPGVPIYSIFLNTMAWRAIARVEFEKNLWTWCQIFTCLGAISFVISDLLIALNMFKFSIPHDQVLVMGTYYAAQLGISLSIVDIKPKKV